MPSCSDPRNDSPASRIHALLDRTGPTIREPDLAGNYRPLVLAGPAAIALLCNHRQVSRLTFWIRDPFAESTGQEKRFSSGPDGFLMPEILFAGPFAPEEAKESSGGPDGSPDPGRCLNGFALARPDWLAARQFAFPVTSLTPTALFDLAVLLQAFPQDLFSSELLRRTLTPARHLFLDRLAAMAAYRLLPAETALLPAPAWRHLCGLEAISVLAGFVATLPAASKASPE